MSFDVDGHARKMRRERDECPVHGLPQVEEAVVGRNVHVKCPDKFCEWSAWVERK